MKRTMKKNRRKGAAMIEFAVVAPLLFLFFFAGLEFCRVAMIRHTADNAAYEGCRVGILPGATAAEVQDEAVRIMSTIGVTDAQVTVAPATIDRETEEVRVLVEVDLDSNIFVPNRFFAGQTIVRELTLRREGIR